MKNLVKHELISILHFIIAIAIFAPFIYASYLLGNNQIVNLIISFAFVLSYVYLIPKKIKFPLKRPDLTKNEKRTEIYIAIFIVFMIAAIVPYAVSSLYMYFLISFGVFLVYGLYLDSLKKLEAIEG